MLILCLSTNTPRFCTPWSRRNIWSPDPNSSLTGFPCSSSTSSGTTPASPCEGCSSIRRGSRNSSGQWSRFVGDISRMTRPVRCCPAGRRCCARRTGPCPPPPSTSPCSCPRPRTSPRTSPGSCGWRCSTPSGRRGATRRAGRWTYWGCTAGWPATGWDRWTGRTTSRCSTPGSCPASTCPSHSEDLVCRSNTGCPATTALEPSPSLLCQLWVQAPVLRLISQGCYELSGINDN